MTFTQWSRSPGFVFWKIIHCSSTIQVRKWGKNKKNKVTWVDNSSQSTTSCVCVCKQERWGKMRGIWPRLMDRAGLMVPVQRWGQRVGAVQPWKETRGDESVEEPQTAGSMKMIYSEEKVRKTQIIFTLLLHMHEFGRWRIWIAFCFWVEISIQESLHSHVCLVAVPLFILLSQYACVCAGVKICILQ